MQAGMLLETHSSTAPLIMIMDDSTNVIKWPSKTVLGIDRSWLKCKPVRKGIFDNSFQDIVLSHSISSCLRKKVTEGN